jgi:hypothetical protein
MTGEEAIEQAKRQATAWYDGHTVGYQKGRDDGIGIGYADAKARAFNSLNALSNDIPRFVRDEFVRALANNLGAQS